MRSSNLVLVALAIVLGLFLAEQILGWAGRPHARPVPVTNPPNNSWTWDNYEFTYEYRTNSQGIRYEEISLDKPAGEKRVFLVGDSYTEGYGLDQDLRFSSLLEARLTKEQGHPYRFINGGMTGTGPLEYWKVMYKVGLAYKPDRIIVCLFANDLSNTAPSIDTEELNRFYFSYYDQLPPLRRLAYRLFPRIYVLLSQLAEGESDDPEAPENRQDGFIAAVEQYLEAHRVSRDDFEEWEEELDPELLDQANKSRLDWPVLAYPILRPRYWYDALNVDTPSAEKKYQTLAFVLDHMVRVARMRGIDIGFIYLPMRYQYDPAAFEPTHPWVAGGMVDRRWLSATTEIQTRLGKWAAEREVPFHDLTARFREEAAKGKTLNFKIDGHWNAEGHAIAADEIRDWMRSLDGQLAAR